jgi:hypothetical protein
VSALEDKCDGDPEKMASTSYSAKKNIVDNKGGECWDVWYDSSNRPIDITRSNGTLYTDYPETCLQNTCTDADRSRFTEKNYCTPQSTGTPRKLTSSSFISTNVACQSLGGGNAYGACSDSITNHWDSSEVEGCVAYIGAGDLNLVINGSSYAGAIAFARNSGGNHDYLISPAVEICSGTPNYDNTDTICKNTFKSPSASTHYCRAREGELEVWRANAGYGCNSNTYRAVKCNYDGGGGKTYNSYTVICGLGVYSTKYIRCSIDS